MLVSVPGCPDLDDYKNEYYAAECMIEVPPDKPRSDGFIYSVGDTTPHAICLTALLAVGIEV